jgi:hypothetical protein
VLRACCESLQALLSAAVAVTLLLRVHTLLLCASQLLPVGHFRAHHHLLQLVAHHLSTNFHREDLQAHPSHQTCRITNLSRTA